MFREISQDPALKRFGAVLGATHLLVALQLWTSGAPSILARGSEALCWPFLDDCAAWRILGPGAIRAFLVLHGAFALVVVWTFLRSRIRVACFGLLILEVARVLVVVQDWRLRLNQHAMGFWIALVFLFVPGKRWTLRALLIAFYVAAGVLKLNPEWLSGAALYAVPSFVPGWLLRVGCAWVVVLELVLVWGVLSRRTSVFVLAVSQLVLFALCSWPIVGFFYPCLMVMFVSFLVMSRDGTPVPVSVPGLLVLALFVAAQAWPRMLPGDPALTGQGRWMALHMFDARVACRASARIRAGDETVQRVDLQNALAPRIRCDPLVFVRRAAGLCAEMKRAGSAGLSVDVTLDSRRATEPELHPVMRLVDVCAQPPIVRAFGRNDWLLE